MGKKLVIVESPTKAKTIGRYLGKDFMIAASVGHIRDLPANTMAVDVNNNFKPIYVTMPKKESVIRELKDLASKSDFVYIATDPDREGEAIAWHIAKALKIDLDSNCRVTFNEITKKAVQEAITSPRTIDMDLVNAQQARRILDRLVGYELSPLLWSKIKKGLSAGRVQSVVTKLVMDKDAEIDKFIPEEYWNINANVTPVNKDHPFDIAYYGQRSGSKLSKDKISNKEEADKVLADVGNNDLHVDSVKKGKKEKNPYPPFTTSTLQQAASSRLGFTSKKTMSVAQQLYEGIEIEGQGQTALISYIRTDSVRISDEAVAASRELIKNRYGEEYVCPFVREYKNRNSAQDAHEAIRPTHFDLDPKSIKESLSSDQFKLYKLIWERFLSTQMSSAKFDTVQLEASVNNRVFRVSGETVTFKGFQAAYAEDEDVNEEAKEKDSGKVKLPVISEGDILKNLKVKADQKFTSPPSHYTEATLIKALEENGIGRPSTYAPTISNVLDKKYVEKKGKFIYITDLGKITTVMLSDNFKNIVDISFTAKMEENLDEVETGKNDWVRVLSDFYPGFHEQVLKAGKEVEKVKLETKKTGESCPLCGSELIEKEGRYGKFIACSNFPDCRYTKNIEMTVNGKCPICGSGLEAHRSKKYSGKTFYTCDKKGSDPDCGFISWDLPVEGQLCPTCGSYMVWKRFRGKSYPKCANKDCASNQRKKKKEE